MARFFANVAFDIDDLNLNRLVATHFSTEFYDNAFQKFNGITYEDVIEVFWSGGNSVTHFGGTSIVVSGSTGAVTGGTITGIVEEYASNGWNPAWGVQNISLSAKAVYDASQTASTADDDNLIRAALSGADNFILSSGGDRARGFGGGDTMYGRGGSDALYGGNGNDKLFGEAGGDRLYADTGADKLNGGRAKDNLHGGTDSLGDDFIFTSRFDSAVGANHDVIHNFTSGADDIDLRGIDAKASTSGVNDAFTWGGKTAGAHDVWWKATVDGVLLRADVTGDTTADFEVLLKGTSTFGSGDVLL